MGSDRPKQRHKSRGLGRPILHAWGQKSHAKVRKGELPGVQKMIAAFLTQILPAVAAIRTTLPAEMHPSENPYLMRYMYAHSGWLVGDSGARVGEG